MNGYEFVTKVLSRTGGDVGPLIELASGREPEWLELKAATGPIDGVLPPGESWGYYYWDVARALFAMANGIGGALLIGVKETTEREDHVMPVGLEDSGFEGSEDKFLLALWDQVLYRSGGWSTPRYGRLQCGERHRLFEPGLGKLLGERVAIITVRPRRPDESYLALTSEDPREPAGISWVIPVRSSGDIGRIETLKSREQADQYWSSRQVDRLDLGERFRRFDADWSRRTEGPVTRPKSDPAVVDSGIRSYIESLKNQFIRLNSVFTPLHADERAPAGSFDATAEEIMGSPHSPAPTSAAATQHRTVLHLLAQEPRAVMLGEPGAGKSTCLMRKALMAGEAWTPGQSWALMVPLSRYGRSGLRALLLAQLPGLAWADIELDIARGEITLLLDALNECPAAYFDSCVQEVSDLLQEYPAARVVISSRFTHNPRRLGLPTFEIQPLNREQQRHFLTVCLGDEVMADRLLDRLYQQPGAGFIASSPVLLRMVADASRDDGSLPAGRASLYRQFFEGWYAREVRKRRDADGPVPWPFGQVRSALALLAFRMRAQGRVSCRCDLACRIVQQIVGEDAEALLAVVAQGLLLSLNETDQTLQFSHETVQEYLAAEHIVFHTDALRQDLLRDASTRRSLSWHMPLVLSLELLEDPPDELLQTAWSSEPLLVSAALRSSSRLDSLPVSGSPWTRGVLHAMRNSDASAEAVEITYTAHHPPKYPLPTVLLNALRGSAYWYAGLTHAEGMGRLEKVRDLLRDGGYPWCELLPDACAGYPALMDKLSPTQRLLVGESADVEIASALDQATVAELCVLLRLKRVSIDAFRARWKAALCRSNERAMERDLICLLSTDKLLGDRFSPARELATAYREQLRRIGSNWKLSFRLLNVLLRLKVMTAAEIRKEPGRLDDIISRTSPMNAQRFMKHRVLKWEEIPDERAVEIALRMPLRQLKELELSELVPPGTAAEYSRHDKLRRPRRCRGGERRS